MDEKRVSAQWRMPDGMWERIERLLPGLRQNPKGGRPGIDNRKIADGVFYVLRSGWQWKAVPREFGSGSTLHRRFQHRVERGVFRKLWPAVQLKDRRPPGCQATRGHAVHAGSR